jgi:hypothetical protein
MSVLTRDPDFTSVQNSRNKIRVVHTHPFLHPFSFPFAPFLPFSSFFAQFYFIFPFSIEVTYYAATRRRRQETHGGERALSDPDATNRERAGPVLLDDIVDWKVWSGEWCNWVFQD